MKLLFWIIALPLFFAGAFFAVANREGAPRTMFKPDDGMAYWQEQKTREARRQTARSERGDRSERAVRRSGDRGDEG